MTVRGLWPLLRKRGLVEEVPAEDLAGMRIAVDLGPWIVGALQVGAPPLRVAFYRLCALLASGLFPVGVADAKHGPEAKLRRRGGGGFAQHGQDLLKLFEACGCPAVVSSGEAESLCGALSARGDVDAVLSPDADALIWGARLLVKKLPTLRGELTVAFVVRAERMLAALGLAALDLPRLAALAGSDVGAGVKGVGVCRAVAVLAGQAGKGVTAGRAREALAQDKLPPIHALEASASPVQLPPFRPVDLPKLLAVLEGTLEPGRVHKALRSVLCAEDPTRVLSVLAEEFPYLLVEALVGTEREEVRVLRRVLSKPLLEAWDATRPTRLAALAGSGPQLRKQAARFPPSPEVDQALAEALALRARAVLAKIPLRKKGTRLPEATWRATAEEVLGREGLEADTGRAWRLRGGPGDLSLWLREVPGRVPYAALGGEGLGEIVLAEPKARGPGRSLRAEPGAKAPPRAQPGGLAAPGKRPRPASLRPPERAPAVAGQLKAKRPRQASPPKSTKGGPAEVDLT